MNLFGYSFSLYLDHSSGSGHLTGFPPVWLTINLSDFQVDRLYLVHPYLLRPAQISFSFSSLDILLSSLNCFCINSKNKLFFNLSLLLSAQRLFYKQMHSFSFLCFTLSAEIYHRDLFVNLPTLPLSLFVLLSV